MNIHEHTCIHIQTTDMFYILHHLNSKRILTVPKESAKPMLVLLEAEFQNTFYQVYNNYKYIYI